MDISIAPTFGRIITEPLKLASRALLETGNGGQTGPDYPGWLRTVESFLRPLNLGLATAKLSAHDRSAWWLLVATTAIRR